MSPTPFSRPDPLPGRSRAPFGEKPDPLSAESSDRVADVARKLAAVGGGDISLDLALDLVLHETVKQARTLTGATGAAIALRRNQEMVCRATTGTNAPDLGVRVETDSGLSGACLATGEVQQCADTQTDARVNAEACRSLGIRSTLLVPLKEKGKTFGILQVFSTEPNAFHGSDVEVLERLGKKLVENRNGQSPSTVTSSPLPTPPSFGNSDRIAEKLRALEERISQSEISRPDPQEEPKTDLWTSVLVALVIMAAIGLGIIIGWRSGVVGGGSNQARNASTAKTPAHSARPTESQPPGTSSNPAEPPAGGLQVSENGKVIYRMPPSQTGTTSDSSSNRLLHTVAPEYPQLARERKIQGSVVLNIQVLGDGSVGNVQIVSGDPLLADAAVRAVQQWRYQPYSISGQAVATQTRVAFKFTLPAT